MHRLTKLVCDMWPCAASAWPTIRESLCRSTPGVRGIHEDASFALTTSFLLPEVVRSNINREKLSLDTALRLGVKNDGCKDSGTQYRYVVELDSDAIRPDDHLFENEGIRIRVDRESLAHLDGLQLGGRQGPKGVEFMFLNSPRET